MEKKSTKFFPLRKAKELGGCVSVSDTQHSLQTLLTSLEKKEKDKLAVPTQQPLK